MMQALLQEALSSCKKDLGELKELMTENDSHALGNHAHRMKGAARIVGDESVIQACEDLELACLAPVINKIDVERYSAILEHAQGNLIMMLNNIELK